MMWRWLIVISVCSALVAALVLLAGESLWIAVLILAFGVLVGLTAGFTESDSNEPPRRPRRSRW